MIALLTSLIKLLPFFFFFIIQLSKAITTANEKQSEANKAAADARIDAAVNRVLADYNLDRSRCATETSAVSSSSNSSARVHENGIEKSK
mgnify:CR=1 FL=1